MNDDSGEGQVEMLRRRIAELETEQTRREQSQQALQAAIKSMLPAMKANLLVVDPDLRIRHLASDMWPDRGDPLGRQCYEYLHGRTAPCPDCFALEALKTDRTIVRERTLPGAKARTFQVAARAFQDEQGCRLVAEIGLNITDLRRAHEDLRASEADFRSLFENSPTGIYRTTPDGRILMANPALVRMLGYPSFEALAARNIEEEGFLPDYPRTRFKVLIEKEGEIRDFEAVWTRQDGTSIVARENARIVRDGQGNVLYYEGTVQDVTELERAEQALQQSEAVSRALLDVTTDRALLFDVDGTLIAINETGAKAFHRTPEELIGRNIYDLLPHDLAETRMATNAEAIRTRRPIRAEDQREGRILDNRIYPVFDSEGKAFRLAIFARDITEQKQAQEALRQSREQLQYVIDNSRDVIFQTDLEGNYIFASKSAEDLTGRPLSEMLRMNMRELTPPEQLPILLERYRRRRAGLSVEQPFCSEIVHKDGHRVPTELVTTPVYRDGKLVAVQGIARDITERKRAEEALRTAHQKLTIASEEERRALARELHDSIGQRLVVLQLAIQNADSDRARPAGSARLRAIARQCRELIREVRHMSHGLYPPTLESLGLAAALRELGQGCQGAGAGKGFAVRISRKLAAARLADPVEIALYRIAQESIHNAIRHGRADRIEIRLDHREGQARLKVTDNGVGFDTSDMTKNGLGLTTMLERAEAVGGKLTITSAPGRTCLEAQVPASLRQHKPHPGAAPRRTPGRAIRKPRRPNRKKES
jgi:PAS domain S-box-containing protein